MPVIWLVGKVVIAVNGTLKKVPSVLPTFWNVLLKAELTAGKNPVLAVGTPASAENKFVVPLVVPTPLVPPLLPGPPMLPVVPVPIVPVAPVPTVPVPVVPVPVPVVPVPVPVVPVLVMPVPVPVPVVPVPVPVVPVPVVPVPVMPVPVVPVPVVPVPVVPVPVVPVVPVVPDGLLKIACKIFGARVVLALGKRARLTASWKLATPSAFWSPWLNAC
jgi:signal-induced proliferation-associated 1 like protein 3